MPRLGLRPRSVCANDALLDLGIKGGRLREIDIYVSEIFCLPWPWRYSLCRERICHRGHGGRCHGL